MNDQIALVSHSLTSTTFDYLGHKSEVRFQIYSGTVVGENVSKYAHVSGEGGGTSIGYVVGKTVVMAQRPITICSKEVKDRRLYVKFDDSGKEVVWKFSQDQFPAREGSRVAVVVGWFSETNMMYELAFISLDTGHCIAGNVGVMFERLEKLPGVDQVDRYRNLNIYKKSVRPKFDTMLKMLTTREMPSTHFPEQVELLTFEQARNEKGKTLFGGFVGVLLFKFLTGLITRYMALRLGYLHCALRFQHSGTFYAKSDELLMREKITFNKLFKMNIIH
ncbi:hypothetical protein [Terasakiella sp.]|uniref:hypothetical protein n=1 Tax=Terasakiella sp. TaxID=2034861 RepID=UPI003AA91C82